MQEKNTAPHNLETPIRYCKGVGPKKSEALERLGIRTVRDILYYLPARYEDRSRFTPARDLVIGEYQAVRGRVLTVGGRVAKTGTPVVEIAVADPTGTVRAVWFNQPYLRGAFEKGQEIALYGKVELFDRVKIVQPEYEIVQAGAAESLSMGRIVPVYPLTADITQKYLRGLIHATASASASLLRETLPTYIRARERLDEASFAVKHIHFPATFETLGRAYRRIVFEEFFILQLALALKRRGSAARGAKAGYRFTAAGKAIDAFKRSLPFELTDGQKKAIAEIERDMAGAKPMHRLLEGDVGSGKTAVAAYALVLAAQNGFQGALMAPTEVLARQHFVSLSEMLMPLGITVALLVSGIDKAVKERIVREVRDGAVDIVVGTHAVIQEGVAFKHLGMVAIDEQHKFGVGQRSFLIQKGQSPHVLLMTATPIPRTLAMTVYGDLDISVIREMPKGRKPIVTYWIEKGKRRDVYGFVKEELEKGRQAYVVCPAIDAPAGGSGRREAAVGAPRRGAKQAATALFEELKGGLFANFTVGLLHGRMTTREKDSVMKEFKKGKIDLLVSTVVIEVGIDVANATVMVIEDADWFGLSQLHQLRGRVGRGGHESYCVLLADPKTDEVVRRLAAVEETLDGFAIAEADLEVRGPGEFFGTRQHGLPEIRFGNIVKDIEIMERARREAFAVVAGDPELGEERHRALRQGVGERFAGAFEPARVG